MLKWQILHFLHRGILFVGPKEEHLMMVLFSSYGWYPKYRVVPETSGLPLPGLPATRWFLKLNQVGSGIERNTGQRVGFRYPLGTALVVQTSSNHILLQLPNSCLILLGSHRGTGFKNDGIYTWSHCSTKSYLRLFTFFVAWFGQLPTTHWLPINCHIHLILFSHICSFPQLLKIKT